MKKYIEQKFTGERALFQSCDLDISYCTFADGESPLKESCNLEISNSLFQWKYPFWYCNTVTIKDSVMNEMARAGIWYTSNISMTDCIIDAPKTFRRTSDIQLKNITMSRASETLWNCANIQMENVVVNGDYFAMNSTDITVDGLRLVGNYSFDGCKNMTIRNAKMISKDAFWNCENVVVYDSYISGEYIGWNSKNVTFINCTIESIQGMCYMENIVMSNCRLINTNLAFEYSSVNVKVQGTIDSIKNPIGGTIQADEIGEVILEENRINSANTKIIIGGMENVV